MEARNGAGSKASTAMWAARRQGLLEQPSTASWPSQNRGTGLLSLYGKVTGHLQSLLDGLWRKPPPTLPCLSHVCFSHPGMPRPAHLPALLAVWQVAVPGEATGREALPRVWMLWSLQRGGEKKTLLELKSNLWAQGQLPKPWGALMATIPLPPSRQGQHFHADTPQTSHNILMDKQLQSQGTSCSGTWG